MKKGFTLIELLAVIVILAIIALIATPIILGIINDAREESNERSVELYASAVRSGIAAYQLREGKEVPPNTYTKDTLLFEVEYDGKVDCESIIISKDGKVSLDKCTVNGGTKEYSYGIEEDDDETTTPELTQVYKPQYYSYDYFSGAVGETVAPDESERLTVAPTGKINYHGYDVTDGVVSAIYACFVRNETEYCIKANDFAKSTEIITDAFNDVLDEACFFENGNFDCNADGLRVCADSADSYMCFNSYGAVGVWGDGYSHYAYADGTFGRDA